MLTEKSGASSANHVHQSAFKTAHPHALNWIPPTNYVLPMSRVFNHGLLLSVSCLLDVDRANIFIISLKLTNINVNAVWVGDKVTDTYLNKNSTTTTNTVGFLYCTLPANFS